MLSALALILAAPTSATTPARSATVPPSAVPPSRGPDRAIPFKQVAGGELKLNVYLPRDWKAHDRRAAIVLWCGGAFRTGRTAQFHSKAEYLAGRGLVSVCAEYRGTREGSTTVNECVEDAADAMRAVRARSRELGIDPRRVAGGGGSAGGALAMLVARAEDAGVRPDALVLFNPALGDGVLKDIGTGGPGQAAFNAALRALASPTPRFPPTTMFFGERDADYLPAAESLHRGMQARNDRGELWIADGVGHGFFNGTPWHEATLRAADDFLVSIGFLSGSSPLCPDPSAVLHAPAATRN